jgi:flagellar biosynthesis/type III secretory pathway protein FliH
MRAPNPMRTVVQLTGALLVLTLCAPGCASAQQWQSRNSQRGAPPVSADPAFQRAYQEGFREGERDARQRRTFDLRRHDAYNDGDRGYNSRSGDRGRYRDEFRRGFEAGYRAGYERVRGVDRDGRRGDRDGVGQGRGGFAEPAHARGYADGFEKGREDWKDRDRYDPVRHGDYRDGDRGYSDNYGSRDAYKQYYREGFREGYEDGYRGNPRDRRR